MTVNLKLDSRAARLAVLLLALVLGVLAARLVFSRFVIGTLADERFSLGRDWLLAGLSYQPDSPRLNARLAEAELFDSEPDLDRADSHAARAVDLSPNDYRWRLILALVKEARGDRVAAEAALREALRLAPNDREVHWRLANVLLRENKLAESIDEFRIAVEKNIEMLPASLDLIWRASRGNVEAVETVAGTAARPRIQLAQFLVKQSRLTEAATVFRGVDRNTRLASIESAAVLNSLIAAGNLTIAHDLWISLVGDGSAGGPLLYNGGFESDILKNFSQFDWTFGRSEYARLSIDRSVAHSGSRSIKIEFAGRDTTELRDEIRQLVTVRPGARYRIECYIKTDQLVTPEGPRVVVSDKAGAWIAASEPAAGGSNDWKQIALEFVAPAAPETGSAVSVSVKRKPKFAYDDPTKGTVWLDDFKMTQISGG